MDGYTTLMNRMTQYCDILIFPQIDIHTQIYI